MSRSGYTEDYDDCDWWPHIRWRGAVASAIRGKRGQSFLREMLAAFDAMEAKRLIREELVVESGEVCAIGAVGRARGIDMTDIDACDRETVADTFGISGALAAEIVYMNDDHWTRETPEARFTRMRAWIASLIIEGGE
jgi:hypothetical protein